MFTLRMMECKWINYDVMCKMKSTTENSDTHMKWSFLGWPCHVTSWGQDQEKLAVPVTQACLVCFSLNTGKWLLLMVTADPALLLLRCCSASVWAFYLIFPVQDMNAWISLHSSSPFNIKISKYTLNLTKSIKLNVFPTEFRDWRLITRIVPFLTEEALSGDMTWLGLWAAV